MTNIITACFGGTRFINTRPAWLIDHGMVLQIKGVELPDVYEVDFSNSKAETATRVLGGPDGVVIPDQYFLNNAKQIYAWVYLTTGDSGFTTLQITIPLSQRPDVTDEPPTPQETSLIEQAIAALNDGVERAETAADDAEEAVANIQQTVDDALQTAKDSGEFDGTDGVNGVTFTPDVDAAGNISWTNDGDLPNPQTRNIKGPKGDKLTYADLTAADKADLVQGPIADAQTAAVNAVNSKGEEVIQSIPSDYTELSEDVDALKSAVNQKAPVIINTASGAIASFADGADGLPIKQLSVNVQPIQSGSGDPSPDNVRPISGRTSATIYSSGADTSDPTTYTIQLGDTVYGGTLDVTSGVLTVDRAMVDLGTLTWVYNSGQLSMVSNNLVSVVGDGANVLCSNYKTATKLQGVYWANTNKAVAINKASAETTGNFAPGAIVVKDTDYTDAVTFKSAMSGVQLCYELATPIEITLTPTQIDTLLGTNNIWSDAGDVDVDYRADTKLYIDNIHQPTDDDMTADAQIASGKYFLIGGNLYKSTTFIPAGDTIIPGTNCIKTNLAEALNALNT